MMLDSLGVCVVEVLNIAVFKLLSKLSDQGASLVQAAHVRRSWHYRLWEANTF